MISDVFCKAVTYTNANTVFLRESPTLENMRDGFKKQTMSDFKIIALQIGQSEIMTNKKDFFEKYYEVVSVLRKKCPNAFFIICSILPITETRLLTDEISAKNAELKQHYKQRSFSDFYSSVGKVCHNNQVIPEFLREKRLTTTGVQAWSRGLSNKIRTIPKLL